MPTPSDQDYVKMGGQFGPHNLHENRPGSFQSSTTIFATWQSAGVRAFDITNPFRPEEVGYFVPPQPTRWAEPGGVFSTTRLPAKSTDRTQSRSTLANCDGVPGLGGSGRT